nr:protein kinase [Mycoplasmopsis agalactiae]
MLIVKDLQQASKVVGSVYYMAPELCRPDNEPTKKTDIYAIGILLYEMLTGKYPIEGKKADETLILQKTMPMPKLTDKIATTQALENVIIKATAKDPFHRYSSAWEMAEDLKTALSEKRIFEKPIDAKKMKPKKNDYWDSKQQRFFDCYACYFQLNYFSCHSCDYSFIYIRK